MKRVFPNQVNLAPECEADANATAGLIKPSNVEGHRRVCSSVAKIGLAISVGASSLVLPGQSNSAVAADRDGAKSPTTFASAKEKAASNEAKSAGESTNIASTANLPNSSHTVVSGETLWQLAQIYQVDATAIAQANGISVGATVETGQVLYIPSAQEAASGFDLAEPTIASPASGEELAARTPANFKLSKQLTQAAPEVNRTATPSALLSEIEKKAAVPTADLESTRRQDISQQKVVPSISENQQTASLNLETDKPTGRSDKTFSSVASEAVHPKVRSRLNAAVHRVRDGETIYEIAQQYNISAKELANLNGLSDPSFIRVGQQIDIPPGATLKPQTSLTVFGNKVTSKSSDLEAGVPRISLPEDRANSATIELAWVDPSRATDTDTTSLPNLVVSQAIKSVDESETESDSWMAAGQRTPETARRLAAKLKPGSGNQASANTDNSEYVEELRAGIDKLRAKHRVSPERNANESVTETVAAVSAEEMDSSARINPEFAPEQHTAALQTEGLQPWSQSRIDVGAAEEAEEFVMAATLSEEIVEDSKVALDRVSDEDSSEVAVAPMGSNNYAPIGAPRMVSPELPSLSAPQAYLPKVAPGTFSPGSQDFNGTYIWPAQGELSSGYGWRWGRMHQGIDIAGPVGTPIVAAAPGVVTYSRWNSGGYGNLVEITHPDGSITLYAHNSRLLVNEGEEVEQGQQIAEMGSTGFSTGPHLHFELHSAGVGAIDPIAYLQ